eukprot:395531-Prorocentrum_minimum.AAC.4
MMGGAKGSRVGTQLNEPLRVNFEDKQIYARVALFRKACSVHAIRCDRFLQRHRLSGLCTRLVLTGFGRPRPNADHGASMYEEGDRVLVPEVPAPRR